MYMSSKILILFIVSLGTLAVAANPQSEEQANMTSSSPSQMTPHARTHANAKITVQSSEAKPYDQTAGPALMEIRLNETFTGDIDGESPVRALQVLRDENLPAWSACNDSAENWADARAPSCFKVQKSSRTARSRRPGLSFPDRGQAIFPGCAARAALKVTLEKGPTDGWIIGSSDAGTSINKIAAVCGHGHSLRIYSMFILCHLPSFSSLALVLVD